MKNPIRNAWYLIWHKPRKFLFALLTRVPWIMPNDEIYIKWFYYLSTGKHLNLQQPTTYNEKLQWLKLYNRKSEYVTMVDKYAVKEYVAKQIGEEYIIPTIGKWDKPSNIEWDKLPNQFVLKTNHDGGNNGVVICKDKSKLNKSKVLLALKRSFNRNVYLIGREWPYKDVKKCVFAEQYIEDTVLKELKDFKFYCFNGIPKILLIAVDRASGQTKMNFYDMDFNPLDLQREHPNTMSPIDKPQCFDEMKQIAAKLSRDIPTVRVDLYEVNGHPYFGELTFFAASGIGCFKPEKWDRIWGDWIELPFV